MPFDLQVCKKRHAGKTVDRFRFRWNNYKESDMKFLRGEESLHEHVLSDGHQIFEEDVNICLIDRTDPADPHKTVYYWMRTLKNNSTLLT